MKSTRLAVVAVLVAGFFFTGNALARNSITSGPEQDGAVIKATFRSGGQNYRITTSAQRHIYDEITNNSQPKTKNSLLPAGFNMEYAESAVKSLIENHIVPARNGKATTRAQGFTIKWQWDWRGNKAHAFPIGGDLVSLDRNEYLHLKDVKLNGGRRLPAGVRDYLNSKSKCKAFVDIMEDLKISGSKLQHVQRHCRRVR